MVLFDLHVYGDFLRNVINLRGRMNTYGRKLFPDLYNLSLRWPVTFSSESFAVHYN